jgi:hypothetical protein
MTCFPVGDHHLGLLVWGEENRTEDYDLKIGEDLLISAFEYLLGLSHSEYATLVHSLSFDGPYRNSLYQAHDRECGGNS